VVPWYHGLVRRIGKGKMQHWVSKSNFGKMDIHEENIDLFWLTGKSRISPVEQLDFQKSRIEIAQKIFKKLSLIE